jgi:hypothetical protein
MLGALSENAIVQEWFFRQVEQRQHDSYSTEDDGSYAIEEDGKARRKERSITHDYLGKILTKK